MQIPEGVVAGGEFEIFVGTEQPEEEPAEEGSARALIDSLTQDSVEPPRQELT